MRVMLAQGPKCTEKPLRAAIRAALPHIDSTPDDPKTQLPKGKTSCQRAAERLRQRFPSEEALQEFLDAYDIENIEHTQRHLHSWGCDCGKVGRFAYLSGSAASLKNLVQNSKDVPHAIEPKASLVLNGARELFPRHTNVQPTKTSLEHDIRAILEPINDAMDSAGIPFLEPAQRVINKLVDKDVC